MRHLTTSFPLLNEALDVGGRIGFSIDQAIGAAGIPAIRVV